MTTQLKERPVVFTTEEVNAVLAGDKTQHRVPFDFEFKINTASLNETADDIGWSVQKLITRAYHEAVYDFECPFGAIGDRLWVQEKHRPIGWSFDDGDVRIQYQDGKDSLCEIQTWEEVELNPNDDYLIAICDELINRNVPMKDGSDCFDMKDESDLPHWRSADVMPKFASRLLLEITDIRIERVQDITVINAQAEGSPLQISTTYFASPFHKACGDITEWFKDYWNNKQSKMSSYEANPWVWVIEFKKVDD
ncbi:hypothetical protein ACS8E2_10245 [Psychrobacter glaciei]|uniref:hypothetical protein n=1 Tax=Psychrobacter glaciei TaxID=619771 RepID=UPI003F4850A2